MPTRRRHDLRVDFRAITGADLRREMSAVSRSDNRAAAGHDPAGAAAIENHVLTAREQTFEAIFEPDHFEIECLRGESYAAQYRVQAGTITAAGQDANPRLHDAKA